MHVLKIFFPHYERGLSQSRLLFKIIDESININEHFAQLFLVKCMQPCFRGYSAQREKLERTEKCIHYS